jgi:hypothetical protein
VILDPSARLVLQESQDLAEKLEKRGFLEKRAQEDLPEKEEFLGIQELQHLFRPK